MTYGNNPPGGYEDQPPGGYGNPPPGGYGNPPPGGYGNPPPGGYGNPREEYGSPPPGGYGNPPQGAPPEGYGSPAGGYANPPGAYPPGPAGYGNPGYGNVPAPGGYGAPTGYGGPQGYGSPDNYANWLQRVGAYLVDLIPVWILYGIGFATGNATVRLLFILAAIALSGYNRWFQAGKTGQSWGKRALGISLISETTGQPIGAGMAFVRDICHIVDGIICGIGYLFPLWDAKRQTLADKIMRTVVVPAR